MTDTTKTTDPQYDEDLSRWEAKRRWVLTTAVTPSPTSSVAASTPCTPGSASSQPS